MSEPVGLISIISRPTYAKCCPYTLCVCLSVSVCVSYAYMNDVYILSRRSQYQQRSLLCYSPCFKNDELLCHIICSIHMHALPVYQINDMHHPPLPRASSTSPIAIVGNGHGLFSTSLHAKRVSARAREHTSTHTTHSHIRAIQLSRVLAERAFICRIHTVRPQRECVLSFSRGIALFNSLYTYYIGVAVLCCAVWPAVHSTTNTYNPHWKR